MSSEEATVTTSTEDGKDGNQDDLAGFGAAQCLSDGTKPVACVEGITNFLITYCMTCQLVFIRGG